MTEDLHLPETFYCTGILYHGAKARFIFDPSLDYDKPDLPIGDGSLTLGAGLYLTDSIELAKEYSAVRHSESPVVYSVYLPDCKFLDLRGNGDNIEVDTDFVRKWALYFSEYLNTLEEETPFSDMLKYEEITLNGIKRKKLNKDYLLRENLIEYSQYLTSLVDKSLSVDLRVLLGSVPYIDLPKNDSEYRGDDYAPTWSSLFSKFVQDILDYDGIIYFEGHEGKEVINSPTYVVYNLNKIKFSEEPLSTD